MLGREQSVFCLRFEKGKVDTFSDLQSMLLNIVTAILE